MRDGMDSSRIASCFILKRMRSGCENWFNILLLLACKLKRCLIFETRGGEINLCKREEAGKRFKTSNWLDLEVLSRSVQISIGRINNILRELKSRGIIELEERDFCTPVKVNPGIKD